MEAKCKKENGQWRMENGGSGVVGLLGCWECCFVLDCVLLSHCGQRKDKWPGERIEEERKRKRGGKEKEKKQVKGVKKESGALNLVDKGGFVSYIELLASSVDCLSGQWNCPVLEEELRHQATKGQRQRHLRIRCRWDLKYHCHCLCRTGHSLGYFVTNVLRVIDYYFQQVTMNKKTKKTTKKVYRKLMQVDYDEYYRKLN